MNLAPLFDQLSPDAVEQEVTQKDQFDTDEVTLSETLIRESHQNSNDARPLHSTGPVRTRIAIKEPDPAHAPFWRSLLEPLRPHLDACEIAAPADLGLPRVLVIEDFGTTGLTGQPDVKDASNFQDFWRRVGRSHKGGDKGGSWGLGKIVFPAASAIRTFFGLTIRDDDPNRRLLMGQSVLKHHRLRGADYHPIGYFAIRNGTGFRIPTEDASFIDAFRQATGMRRQAEPGLSIAIPFLRDEIGVPDMTPYVVRNYFFPILTGRLEVEVAGETVNPSSFDALAKRHGDPALADGHLIAFIRDVHRKRSGRPDISFTAAWVNGMGSAIDPEALKRHREAYARGDLVHARAPISLTRQTGATVSGEIDLFVRRAADGVDGKSLFVRSSLTVPNESQFFPSRRAFAALVVDGPVAEFLRDAENPAHTKWNGKAEKLNDNWKSPAQRLSRIRNSLRGLNDLLAQAVEWTDAQALIKVLSVPDSGPEAVRRKRPRVIVPPVAVPPITPRPKLFAVRKLANGFLVKSESGLTESELPFAMRIRAGYDLVRGDPFAKHSPFDFDMTSTDGGIEVTATGASCAAVGPNELRIEATTPAFEVRVIGFDTRRDLKVRATRESR